MRNFWLVASVVFAGCGGVPTAKDAGAQPDGGVDAGKVDAGTVDAGTVDAGMVDAGTVDAGSPDAGSPDAGMCAQHEYRDVSIPMRDGKSLAAFVRVPTNPACRVPVIVIQTPYGKDSAKALWFEAANAPLFGSRDYAFVVVDWRGFFGSFAARVPGQPPYGEDGYDLVEWAAVQPWSTGAVGLWGVSALCVQQFRTAVKKPPHLKAAVPIFCEANTPYAQFYPGGVLRREYYNFLASYFGATVALSNPYDSFAWTVAGNLNRAQDVEAPMLIIAGWWDNFPAGTFDTFSKLTSLSPARAQMRMLVGPWIHFAVGGETSMGRALDAEELSYMDPERKIQRDSLEFFELHLRQRASAASAWSPVRYLLRGSSTEVGLPSWPPPSAKSSTLYFTSTGSLSTTAPTTGSVTFPYDPASPSPTQGGGTLVGSLHHGPTSQDAVLAKGDAVSFVSEVLPQALEIAGTLAVSVDLSTTGVDTDVAVRLTDVDATGKHLLIAEGIRRVKLRTSYSTPSLLPAGTRATIAVPFTSDLAYTFAAGHRVGLIVSGSNFPRFDRNPNTGDDFVPDAGSPVQVVTTRLFTDGSSRVVLPTK